MNSLTWDEENQLTHKALEDLFANQIALIRLKGFVSPSLATSLADHIQSTNAFGVYSGHSVTSGLSKLGPVQCEFNETAKSEYFYRAAKIFSLLERTELPINPLIEVLKLIHLTTRQPVGLAHDAERGPYYAGVYHCLRDVGMALHMDYAPQDAKGWSIEGVLNQISWVLHLKAPVQGGETMLYQREWIPSDESSYKAERSYHYLPEVVKEVTSRRIAFQLGDLIMFNSRNYHEILKCQGTRITVGSFIGRLEGGQLLFWS